MLFGLTEPLSVKLQRPNQTFGKSMNLVKTVISSVEASKNNFDEVMETAKELAKDLDIPILLPRGRTGKKRANIDLVEFYRTERFEPFINEMVTQLKDRFPEDYPAFKLQDILPPHITEIDSKNTKKSFDSIIKAAEMYEDDLPCIDSLRGELSLWHQKMSNEKPKDPDYGFCMKEVFELSTDFPNVHAIVRLLMTIPATSCTAERAFSTLKRVKTAHRSTMGDERLEALMLMSIFSRERLSVDEVVNKFMELHSRRF